MLKSDTKLKNTMEITSQEGKYYGNNKPQKFAFSFAYKCGHIHIHAHVHMHIIEM